LIAVSACLFRSTKTAPPPPWWRETGAHRHVGIVAGNGGLYFPARGQPGRIAAARRPANHRISLADLHNEAYSADKPT
jgi:hypothetical protein